MQQTTKLQGDRSRQTSNRRNGSTLLIVVALLGMLAFLGFVFYTFAKQERANAVTFSQGAQVTKAPSLEPDALFDFVLQQIILGPPDVYTQSVLWGGRHSLLANMFGRDTIPWNGEGVSLIQDQTTQAFTAPHTCLGMPRVDMNFNGLFNDTNDNQALLALVDSPAANPSTGAFTWAYSAGDATWSTYTDSNGNTYTKTFRGTGTTNFSQYIPEPDVNYNSPDINSLFLSYDGTAIGLNGGALDPTRVIIPSFLRPQYLRTPNGPVASTIAQWYQNAPANQIMRPHPNHVCVDGSGNTLFYPGTSTPIPRYTSLNDPAAYQYQALNLRRPFTFGTGNSAFAPDVSVGQPSTGNLGVWTPTNLTSSDKIGADGADLIGNPPNTAFAVQQLQYQLDVDTDGDGIRDSILMDLGYPPVRRGDGKLVVPLFAISIRDLNGLLNLNANGNLSGNINLNSLPAQNQLGASAKIPGSATFTADNLSKSNLGLSTYEINVERALTADPSKNGVTYNDPTLITSEAGQQLSYFLQLFDNSIATASQPKPGRSIAELANLEWLLLNVGRPSFHLGLAQSATNVSQLTNAIADIFTGRYGESTQGVSTNSTYNNLAQTAPVTAFSNTAITGYNNSNQPGNPRLYPSQALSTDVLPSGLATFLNFLSNGSINTFDLPKPGVSTSSASANQPTSFQVGGANNSSTNLNPYNVSPDDNWNAVEGEPAPSSNIRWVHPLDFLGTGQQFQKFNWGADGQPGVATVDDDNNGITDDFSEEGWQGSDDQPAYGKRPEFVQLTYNGLSTKGSVFWPGYSGYHSYWNANNPNWTTLGGVRWGDPKSIPKFYNQLMRNSEWSSLIDDPTEMIVDPTLMSPAYLNYLSYLTNNKTNYPVAPVTFFTNAIANDSVFSPEEMIFLQGSSADSRLSDSRSRLAELMPANLVASQAAIDIRKRLTTVSSDRREFGLGTSNLNGAYDSHGNYQGGVRAWESNPSFPPYVASGAPNPYRAELYYYLNQLSGVSSPSQKLDVNRWLFLDGVIGNQYGFAALPEQTSITDVSATKARQNLARDIYTLLYTLGYVHRHTLPDGTVVTDADYRTVAPSEVPTLAQAKEMAQFAINLVDALDTDNFITAFYFDPDLSNNPDVNGLSGWDPNAFKGPDNQEQTADDFVVYGVERQLLTFSEACTFTVQKTATDSKMTIFDDSAATHTYLFFELQNVSPMDVSLASSTANGVTTAQAAATTADWRVRLTNAAESQQFNILYFLPSIDVANNYMTPDPNGGAIPVLLPGQTFSVATQDGNDLLGGTPRTSDFRADLTGNGTAYKLVVPQVGADGVTAATESPTPSPSTPASSMKPHCNLDLAWKYNDNLTRFVLLNGNSPGSFISQLPGQPSVRLHLERRAAAGQNPSNPNDPAWQSSVWVPVDKTSNTTPNATAPDVVIGTVQPSTPTTGFNTYFRTIPILRGSIPTGQTPGSQNTFNSSSNLKVNDVNSMVWQLHNDRDFGSLSELLQLPLYGPDQLTAALAVPFAGTGLELQTGTTSNPVLGNPPTNPKISICMSEFYTSTLNSDGTVNGGNQIMYHPTIAAARFLRPDNPDYTLNIPNTDSGLPTVNNGNRWYRLLNLLEVPNRSNQHQAIIGTPPSGAASFGTTGTYGTPVTFTNPGTPGSSSYSATSTLLKGSFDLPQYFGWPTTQGLLNLNMVRHPQVLMALIDDDQIIYDPRLYTQPNALPSGVSSVSPYLDDAVDPSFRQWWIEFLKSRDSRFNTSSSPGSATHPLPGSQFGPDPVAMSVNGNNLYVPGTANSRPFRGLDIVGQLSYNNAPAPVDSPIENTVLRSLPIDSYSNNNGNGNNGPPNESRRLFEIGNNITGTSSGGVSEPQEHYGQIVGANGSSGETNPTSTSTPLHPSARYRLMSKLMNNTTTRSNSFAVYVTVQYYEAVQVPTSSANVTATRIGGLLDDAPVHRGFFIVDRSGALDQMKVVLANANAANSNTPGTYSTSFPVSAGSFSFQANTDTSGNRYYAPGKGYQNGIRWKDLVLYRQTLN